MNGNIEKALANIINTNIIILFEDKEKIERY